MGVKRIKKAGETCHHKSPPALGAVQFPFYLCDHVKGNIFEYAFSELGYKRLIADMHFKNLQSQKVAKSLQMDYEGIYTKDSLHKRLRYSINKE